MKKEHILMYISCVMLGISIAFFLMSRISKSQQQQDVQVFNGDYSQWAKLNLILQQIDSHYADEVDLEKVTDAAVVAALGALDPHSVYLPPAELEQADTELAPNFEGVGITFNVPEDTVVVLSVIPGGPSQKAGILPGDQIIKVDDRTIAGVKMHQDSIVRLIKGPSGSNVTLHVLRDGTMIDFSMERGKIPLHSIDAAFMLDDGETAYIKLSKFSSTTALEFLQTAYDLLHQGMKSMIFDLRGNTGGYFDPSYIIANQFLAEGDMIVYMEGREYPRHDFRADGLGGLQDIELFVLSDETSASSSEIFMGAIQDNDRGLIFGRRSFGKGLVQEPIYFSDGSGLRLTVARYYTPSGRCIQKPYDGDAYMLDLFERYNHGEMLSADSIKVDSTDVYYTKKGRPVYGGGGIIPDVFVPIDTTLASDFFMECSKKTTSMRFANAQFSKYKAELSQLSDCDELEAFFNEIDLESQFLEYAANVDSIKPASAKEWDETRVYMMPQIKALVARYSKLGEEAFYRFYMPIDNVIQTVLDYSEDSE